MFKSIEYKLYLYIVLLILSVAGVTILTIYQYYAYAGLFLLLFLIAISQLHRHYRKFNKNILFLLNALDNGDYSFHFSTTKLSKREQELNQMMNRIKEILSRARQEVIENEQFLSHIVQSIPTGIIILDTRNNIKETNEAAGRLLGLPILTHLNQLKVIDESLPELFMRLKSEDENQQITITDDKEQKQISLGVSNIRINKEALRIITLYSIESELEAKEMESWAKLIRIMTHEIMNSIAPITSLTEMLLQMYQSDDTFEDGFLEGSTVDSLGTIHSTAKDLTAFVNSYREYSRISTPNKSHFSLLPFVDSIVKLETAELEAQNISTVITCDQKEITIHADRSQISRVIVNLLKNAIEATSLVDERAVKISIETLSDHKVKIDVANRGNPIPDDILENIFIPFYTTKHGGSGIGLSVSRYILRLHGGNLKHSYQDGWTVFSVVI